MENSIPIPQGKPGMEWNLEYSMVEPTSKNKRERRVDRERAAYRQDS